MGKKNYEETTEELILPVIQEFGLELVDVEWAKEGKNYFLRVYIDKEGGVTIDDCEAVSRKFNDILDEKDYIEEVYTFEVSSPGLDRPLKKEKDFARSIGKDVEIHLFKARDGEKDFVGELISYDKETVTIRDFEENEIVFTRKEISMIRLAFFL